MYRDSGDFKLLTKVMAAALRGFLERSDVALPRARRRNMASCCRVAYRMS